MCSNRNVLPTVFSSTIIRRPDLELGDVLWEAIATLVGQQWRVDIYRNGVEIGFDLDWDNLETAIDPGYRAERRAAKALRNNRPR
mgnify:CR=1 FL=1